MKDQTTKAIDLEPRVLKGKILAIRIPIKNLWNLFEFNKKRNYCNWKNKNKF